ncbi:lytic murein transglycosylase [Xanthomonadaceae bacterium JHOS43]|nr:lytic murein transglycosylase [Xanthomonadaceae bacterium JHOS43]
MKFAALLLLAALAPTASATADAAFSHCLQTLRGKASAAGVPPAAFDAYTRDLSPDPSVLELLDAQPEFTTPIWDYLAALVDSRRIAQGREMLARHAETLERVEEKYRVDPATVVAVWGVESDYGQVFGKRPLLQSLATLSCAGRRQSFFQGELFALLKLLHAGDLSADGLAGSWAGAFGHTQFMPSTYARIAVDFDGDGRRDLVSSIADALASTAHYLQRSGWRGGEPWGFEVRIPEGFDVSLAGRKNKRALADWSERGITRVDGEPVPNADVKAALLLPAGAAGPAWLALRNYDAIYSYNAAESYALAIALLSDQLRDAPAQQTPWPTDDPGLGRDERQQLQRLLLARGHAIGEADGLIGTLTRRAIVVEQQRLGLEPADGRAGRKILDALLPAHTEPANESPVGE